MTHEQKQLLIKDLCGRLPHGVHCCVFRLNENIKENDDILYGVIGDNVITLKCDEDECLMYYQIKPYLRPMSSMTEDEREEIEVFIFNEWYQENSCKIDKEGWIEILANYDVSGIDPCFCSDYIDWLNAHHFDYRGLIGKGLALEAPEDMYKTE